MAATIYPPGLTFHNGQTMPDPQIYSHVATLPAGADLVFTSGIIGQRKDGSFPQSLEEQLKVAFDNLTDALNNAGCQPRDIVKATFYVVDWSIDQAHALFGGFLSMLGTESPHKPLTALVPVAQLAFPEVRFEVEVVAAARGLQSVYRPETLRTLDVHIPIREVDVVVVGGGFSGVQAAWDIQKAGLSCILLEARSRIGGRSHSKQVRSGDGIIELGATWINELTQPKIFATAKRLGLSMAEQFTDGDDIWQLQDGTVLRGRPGEESLAPINESVAQLLGVIEEASKDLDLKRFDSFPQQDDVTVAAWFKAKGYGDAVTRAFINLACVGLVGRGPDDLGIHYLLDYMKSGGGLVNLTGEGQYGAQSLKIREGTSAIATGLANELLPHSVLLDSPVTEIIQTGDKVKIFSATGASFLCRKAIVAIPTNVYKHVRFTPSLPHSKRDLVSHTMGGLYAKIILTYSQPWWRNDGLVGKFSSFTGPICFSWDASDPSKQQYSLAIFVAGEIMARWAALEGMQKEEAVIDHLCDLVGPDLASSARDVLEVNSTDWTTERYIEGAPTSSMGPGMLSQHGNDLRECFKNIHFAGAETAYEWKGYLEGALRAGSRAADEVIASVHASSISKPDGVEG